MPILICGQKLKRTDYFFVTKKYQNLHFIIMLSSFKVKLASLISAFYKEPDSSSAHIKQKETSPIRSQFLPQMADKITQNKQAPKKSNDLPNESEQKDRKLKEGPKYKFLEGSIDSLKEDQKGGNKNTKEEQKQNEFEQNKTVLKGKKGNAKPLETSTHSKKSQLQNINTEKSNFTKEDSFLYEWMKEKQPDFYLIKFHQNSKKKARIEEIKRKRQEEFEKSIDIDIKEKLLKKCIICSEEALIKESVQLACTHRIHHLCKEIVKWKPKMKCSLCERQSIRQIPLHFNPSQNTRMTGFSIQKGHFL